MVARVAYGTRLDTELPLEGLPSPTGDELTTVRIAFDEDSSPSAHDLGPADVAGEVSGKLLSFHVDGAVEIRWNESASFRLRPGEAHMRCGRGRHGTVQEVEEWLLQYVLPLHLQMERHLGFLHGAAVRVGYGAVGFLAPSGGGKSTLSQYFTGQGHGFLTDDKLGFVHRGERILAVPATPFYRLGAKWERAETFVPTALPLRAIYLLQPAAAAAEPDVTPLSASEATFALARRCELQMPPVVRTRLGLAPATLERFHDCARVAARVPVRRLRVPRHYAQLPEVYRAVAADLGDGQ